MLLSLLGVFQTILPLIILAVIVQLVLCKYLLKYRFIIPILSFLYLFFMEIKYFESTYLLFSMNINYFYYGLLLILPYGSMLFITLSMSIIIHRKNKKDKEIEKMKIMDL